MLSGTAGTIFSRCLMDSLYSSLRWQAVRARTLRRDGSRCTVARLLGGRCSTSLHVHHIVPVSDGGEPYDIDNLASVCSSHHPQWEALRRAVVARRARTLRCPHYHRTAAARQQCEARLARSRGLAVA